MDTTQHVPSCAWLPAGRRWKAGPVHTPRAGNPRRRHTVLGAKQIWRRGAARRPQAPPQEGCAGPGMCISGKQGVWPTIGCELPALPY